MKRISIRLAFLLALFVSSCSTAEASKEEKEYVRLFDWVVEMFENSDAGFKYYLEEIGRDEFDRRVADYRKKVAASTSEEECTYLINQWLYTFRKGHIGLIKKSLPLSEEEKRKARAEHESAERVDWTEETFLDYLKKGEGRSPLEGVWMLFGDSVGIVRSDSCFDVFTIRGDGQTSFPMQKIGTLTERKDGKYDYVVSPYKKYVGEWLPHSKSLFSVELDPWKWWAHKLFPVEQRTKEEERFFRLVTKNEPFMERLTRNTLYLCIPSFMPQHKSSIVQLLAKYDKELRKTPNLIIDIRYGTGGTDDTHYALVPYYYTRSIRWPILTLRASEQNIALAKSLASTFSGDDSLYMLNLAKKMEQYVGGYTKGGPQTILFGGMRSLPNPKRVAIICNKQNGSADEALLYMAKQSYKTKIFGHSSGGAFDFSLCMPHTSPDGKYSLILTLSASQNRIDGYSVDDIGIQPDFYIDDSVPEDQWVNYVLSIIEEGE